MVQFSINGISVRAEKGTSILDAARQTGIKIPTLCYSPDLPAWGACGLCIVRVGNSPKLVRACATPVDESIEGKNIVTHDTEINATRRTVLELILSTHPSDCLHCARNGSCELQSLAADFDIRDIPYQRMVPEYEVDDSGPSIILDPRKCVKCGRCVKVCQGVQNVWALEFIGRGFGMKIAAAADVPLNESPCIKCGQCAAHCPVGAIYERDETGPVWNALYDPDRHTVVQIAPSVRVALAEEFGLEPGTLITGQIYAALRRLGFDTVFDTNFGADLTIMEESGELIKRLGGSGPLPLITTCCPAWVDYLEKYYPDMIPNFSTAKSPQQMLGSMIKAYWAKKAGIAPEKVYSVSIMPCTAKKWEIKRNDDMKSVGTFLKTDTGFDVDQVLTTRELAKMIKQAGIEILKLPAEDVDNPLGPYTGAGTIFGVTGGVMEAAIRTAYNTVTGHDMADLNFTPARGLDGIKEATVDFGNGAKIRIAVAHQMGNIASVLDRLREARNAGETPPYEFVEVMACRGGCIAGGGQPYGATDEVRQQRAEGIYRDDRQSEYRCSHENPHIKELYEE
ncbi:MAG: [FeFe] hydrogenase, group A, partial [Treponema sp.]|nr:[FeFe] hydrogenase, group A [Treponema sp.]